MMCNGENIALQILISEFHIFLYYIRAKVCTIFEPIVLESSVFLKFPKAFEIVLLKN